MKHITTEAGKITHSDGLTADQVEILRKVATLPQSELYELMLKLAGEGRLVIDIRLRAEDGIMHESIRFWTKEEFDREGNHETTKQI